MFFELNTYSDGETVINEHDRILIKENKNSETIAAFVNYNPSYRWYICPYNGNNLYKLSIAQHKLLIEKLNILNSYRNVDIEFLVNLLNEQSILDNVLVEIKLNTDIKYNIHDFMNDLISNSQLNSKHITLPHNRVYYIGKIPDCYLDWIKWKCKDDFSLKVNGNSSTLRIDTSIYGGVSEFLNIFKNCTFVNFTIEIGIE